MFRKKKKKIVEAEQQKLPDLEEVTPEVRGRKYEPSKLPRTQVVSRTRVKNPVENPDDYNPANKFGVDDRLLAYFYTKTEIDKMDLGGGGNNTGVVEDILLRLDALEKHTHNYDGDLVKPDKVSGNWDFTRSWWEMGGTKFTFTIANNFTNSTNIMEIGFTDAYGRVVDFSNVVIGDTIEIIQDENNKGTYKVTRTSPQESTIIFHMNKQSGVGEPAEGAISSIRIWEE